VEIRYPVLQPGAGFHFVRVFMDEELEVPVRYEAYDFPERDGESPPLLEEYTYLRMRLNANLTDDVFRRSELGTSVP
jgi:hypothetical protein